MPNINIPFQEEFREPMLTGQKTATTRTKRYGYPGDIFKVFGKVFVLTSVASMQLANVAVDHYREEGFSDPRYFIATWDRLHPRVHFWDNPKRRVYFHTFTLVNPSYPQTRTVEQAVPLAGLPGPRR